MKITKVLYVLFVLGSIFPIAKAQNTHSTSVSQSGDIVIPLGKFQIGTSIDVEMEAAGPWAEVAGKYQIVCNWGATPRVAYRAQSWSSSKVKFYAYNAGNGYIYLFLWYDNNSPSDSYVNTVGVETSTYRYHDPNQLGDFNQASELEDLFVIRSENECVGIGTNAPTHKLEVAGAIRAQELILEASPWPDFVFDEDYALPTLQEVETHIAEKGHLPGVPSAAEIHEKGLGVSAAQTVMMQKLEELTLYVIEQDKRLKAQEAMIERLQLRLEKEGASHD